MVNLTLPSQITRKAETLTKELLTVSHTKENPWVSSKRTLNMRKESKPEAFHWLEQLGRKMWIGPGIESGFHEARHGVAVCMRVFEKRETGSYVLYRVGSDVITVTGFGCHVTEGMYVEKGDLLPIARHLVNDVLQGGKSLSLELGQVIAQGRAYKLTKLMREMCGKLMDIEKLADETGNDRYSAIESRQCDVRNILDKLSLNPYYSTFTLALQEYLLDKSQLLGKLTETPPHGAAGQVKRLSILTRSLFTAILNAVEGKDVLLDPPEEFTYTPVIEENSDQKIRIIEEGTDSSLILSFQSTPTQVQEASIACTYKDQDDDSGNGLAPAMAGMLMEALSRNPWIKEAARLGSS